MPKCKNCDAWRSLYEREKRDNEKNKATARELSIRVAELHDRLDEKEG